MTAIGFATAGYICPTSKVSVSITTQKPIVGGIGAPAVSGVIASQTLKGKIVDCPPGAAFEIETFALVGGAIEIGDTLALPAFTASYNQAVSAATLSDDDGNPSQALTPPATAFSSVNSYVKTTPLGAVTWTLNATGPGGADSAQATKTWLPLVFTGVLAGAGPYTEAEIEGLAQQVLQSSAAKSTTLSPTFQYIVHAYPATFGPKLPSNFTIGNFGSGDMSEIQTALSITNAHGVTTTYRVARSDNLLNAPSGIAFGVT